MICILPTDTCYGLSGGLTQEDFDAIYALKGRDIQKKLAFLVRDFSELRNIALVSDEQLRILRSYPYPFSVLLPPNPHYSFPDFIKLDSYQYISVRIWEIFLPASLRESLDFPLFLTSANRSGEPETTTALEAQVIFPDVPVYDGGVCDGMPSDIFSFWSQNEFQFLRNNYFEQL